MPSTRTKRSPNLGTASSSPSLTSSSDKTSNAKVAKISRFFTKLPKEEMSSESPYRNCLKQVKGVNLSDSAGDLDDFRTPSAIKKVSKIARLPKRAKTKKKSSVKAPMRKFLEDNFKNSDVNADSLQMALALSESSYEAENPNSQEKMDNFKKTLEKYGFGYGKNKGGTSNKKDFYSIVTSCNKPRNTKSRYRFVTPILKMRTPEEREALISSKVSLILAQNNRPQDYSIQRGPIKLFCDSLQEYHASKIFKLHNLSLEELNREGRFYAKGLPVEACAAPCGYLLKDWGRIPGRDISPVRENVEEKSSCRSQSPVLLKSTTPQRESPKYVYDGSVSPDLFGSDDEADRALFEGPWAKSPLNLGPPIINRSGGKKSSIMNSFRLNLSNTEETEIVECYDLTQSDEELEENTRNPSTSFTRAFGAASETKTDSNCSKSEDRDDLKISEKKDVTKSHRKGSFLLSSSSSEDSEAGGDFAQSKKQNEDEVYVEEYCWTEPDLEDFPTEKDTKRPSDSEILSEETGSKNCQSSEYGSLEPSLKNDNMEKALPETEYSHLSISSTEEIPEERLTESESQRKSEENPEHSYQDLTHDSEEEWQSDTIEYQFSESLISNRKNSEPPDSQLTNTEDGSRKSPESTNSRINTSNSDGFRNTESVKSSRHMTPEWEYHSVEYDWQSDAVFQFPEDERSASEDTKHNRQTSEPPEHTNLSPEPFVDDWIPPPPFEANEEMECYDLSEDDLEHVKKMEKISSSEDSKLSQGSISISDDELNYSSVYATPHHEEKDNEKNLAPLEDSFNDVLGRSMILRQLEPQNEVKTPNIKITGNDNFVIKTKDVTPMANYDEMDTPKIVKELDKFGLKPLKRQRGAKLLKYIYDSTHPLVEEGSDDDGRAVKKRRTGSLHFDGVVGDIDEDEWIFEKTQSKRVQSCRIPLHIVWHNFVMSNPKVRENILLYEPLQLEVLHSMLKEQGFKFNIQDLLAFLDRKCVTIRTAQGQRHGKKRPNS